MKRIIGTCLLLFSLIGLSSCSNNVETSSTEVTSVDENYTFNDYEGEKVIAYNPKNVALLYPSFGDIWKATGGTISIGVEDCITRGYADSNITIVGEGTGKTIDLEALVASKPDFVILSHDFPNHDDYAASLKEFGIPYALFEFNSYDDYLHILKVFSDINKSDAYNKYGEQQKNKINSIIEEAKGKSSKKVLLLRSSATKFSALSKTNFVGAMINELNAINIADTNKNLSTDLSMEVILKENPDIILIVPMGDEEVAFKKADEILDDDLWKNVSAVKNNKVYKMEKDLFHYKPNTRWDQAYELLYQRIYQ